MTRATTLLPVLLLAGACIPSEGPMMSPFEDCLGCHKGGGGANRWTVAGTWAKGARISIVDANGKTVNLRGNDAGNFYSAESLALPFTASVDGRVMPGFSDPTRPAGLTYGGCNLCHRAEVVTVVPGPQMLPGADCLVCHAPGGMGATRPAGTFYAAGTFPPPEFPVGTTVRVGGSTTTTNAVGNFYITAPIAFPAAASVGGEDMEGGAPYGGCNACHVNGKAED